MEDRGHNVVKIAGETNNVSVGTVSIGFAIVVEESVVEMSAAAVAVRVGDTSEDGVTFFHGTVEVVMVEDMRVGVDSLDGLGGWDILFDPDGGWDDDILKELLNSGALNLVNDGASEWNFTGSSDLSGDILEDWNNFLNLGDDVDNIEDGLEVGLWDLDGVDFFVGNGDVIGE